MVYFDYQRPQLHTCCNHHYPQKSVSFDFFVPYFYPLYFIDHYSFLKIFYCHAHIYTRSNTNNTTILTTTSTSIFCFSNQLLRERKFLQTEVSNEWA
jgi:hypothetical protein